MRRFPLRQRRCRLRMPPSPSATPPHRTVMGMASRFSDWFSCSRPHQHVAVLQLLSGGLRHARPAVAGGRESEDMLETGQHTTSQSSRAQHGGGGRGSDCQTHIVNEHGGGGRRDCQRQAKIERGRSNAQHKPNAAFRYPSAIRTHTNLDFVDRLDDTDII